MGPTQIHGLPAHVLLVHVVVVLVPLTALLLVACAVWPAVQRRLGVLVPLLALVSLVSVPITTHAGEWLERRVDGGALLERHTELGDELLPWAIGLFVVAVGVWWLVRAAGASGAPGWVSSVPVRVVVAVVAAVVSVGAVVQVYRIGDSGAKAAWHDRFSNSAQHGGDGDDR